MCVFLSYLFRIAMINYFWLFLLSSSVFNINKLFLNLYVYGKISYKRYLKTL